MEDFRYENRDKLKSLFLEKSQEVVSFAKEPWEKIRVSIGVAAYDHEIDKTVNDVIVHAGHSMYQNKRRRKKENR